MASHATLLFTAFEPSGDALAAKLIAQLRRERPDISIYALGGPLMAKAGATLLETTTEHATMLASAVGQIRTHQQRLGRLKKWLSEHSITALVPVDSPAANWSICGLVRRTQPQAKVIHLVLPQIWAWAPWRIHKLRRLTHHVLCLLPFEPQWLKERNVAGTFVGHPVYETRTISKRLPTLPVTTRSKMAVLPGSRKGEIRKNWPTMAPVLIELQKRHPLLVAVIALRDDASVRQIFEITKSNPKWAALNLQVLTEQNSHSVSAAMVMDRTDEVLDWADVVLSKSGTSTLQIASHRKPMVVFYNTSWWTWHLAGKFLVRTRTFALPNVIAEAMGLGRVVPELVPHFGQVEPVVLEMEKLLKRYESRRKQIAAFEKIAAEFANVDFATRATAVLLGVLEQKQV